MIKIGSLIGGLVFSFALGAHAATTVQSTVDRNEMGLGDSFTLTVSVSSSEEVDVQEPRAPKLAEFELLNSWSSSAVSQKLAQTDRGMQFETQRRKDFHYLLSPRKEGTWSVSSFEVVVSGKVFRTQPVVIYVGPQSTSGNSARGNKKQQGNLPRMPHGFEDPFDTMDNAEEEMFNQLLHQRQRLLQQMQNPGGGMPAPGGAQPGPTGMKNPAFRSLPTNVNEAFFISVELDKTEAYEGEQITANWYVYTRGNMESLDRLKFPDLKGFWKEIIEEVPSIQFTEEIVNGLPWKKALLASHALFPIKAGTVSVDEYKIKSRVRLMNQGMGFMGPAYEFTKSSARVPITVKPLPVDGRPSDFTGAVGQFELRANVENVNVPVNQPLSLKVRFDGSGNAKLIELPAMELPSALEQYDTKSEAKFFKNGRSYKEFEVLLIPRQEGEVTIPALSVSMFDPSTAKYYTRKTQPITLKVVNNPNAPVGSSQRMANTGKSASSAVQENKLPEIVMAWQPSAQGSVMGRSWYWILVFAGICLVLGIKAQKEFGWGQRRRTLKELVQKRYKTLDHALGEGNFRKVGTEMTNVYYIVLANLSGEISGEGGAARKIESLLELIPPSIRRDFGGEISKSFEVFQTLSFAPEEMLGSLKDQATMTANVERAKKLVSELVGTVSQNEKS